MWLYKYNNYEERLTDAVYEKVKGLFFLGTFTKITPPPTPPEALPIKKPRKKYTKKPKAV